jgi:hypothetical protein
MPETTPHPNAELVALAAEFEAAWAAESALFNSSSTDAEANAAAARVREIAQKIVALRPTDVALMRLKARVYLWFESTNFEAFAAENEGNGWSGGSSFRCSETSAQIAPSTQSGRQPDDRRQNFRAAHKRPLQRLHGS